MLIIRKNNKLGNYIALLHQGFGAHDLGLEEFPQFDQQGNPILDEEGNQVIEYGDRLYSADWDEAWGPAPSDADLEAWQEPGPEPPPAVTDVEIMTPVFIDYRRQATLHMDGLKAQVWSYLKNLQSMDPAAATAAGVAFCKSATGIGVQYDDYIKAGGHPDAAADLWARIQEIKGNFTWFDAGVEAIFAAALGQEV